MIKPPFHTAFVSVLQPSGAPQQGLLRLATLAPPSKSASLLYVLGDERQSGRGYTSNAVAKMLMVAFTELKIVSVDVWVVEQSTASVKVLTKNGFRLSGRQPCCHVIDGDLLDRLRFDVLSTEHVG